MDIIEKISIDLLFVMDIKGSITRYLNKAKQNVLNIMNKITSECPSININLGFIGYRDVKEVSANNYVNKDFTQDHENLLNSIKNIISKLGADIPEDVAWAMERP